MTTANRIKDPNLAREQAQGTSSNNDHWIVVARIMEDEGVDIQTANVEVVRRSNPIALFFGVGLTVSALALAAGAALGATCPAGSEPVTVGGETICQKTTPITFEKDDDKTGGDFRGSGRAKKEKPKPDPRSELPEPRVPVAVDQWS